MFEIIGNIRLYTIDLDEYEILYDTGFKPNMIVESGKEFILDEIFDNSKWNSGNGIQAMALGDSTDTNTGIQGPNDGRDITISGAAWNGVSEEDYKLSSEIARSSILSVTRTDQSIVAIAQFVDGQFSASSPVEIREAGIFLHETTAPSADPDKVPSQKPYAMIARRVYYGKNAAETKYVDRPFYKVKDGNPLMMEYKLELV